MKIVLDRAFCCGNLECVRIAPSLFAETKLGLGEVILASPPPEHEAAARLAFESCPAGAIALDDDDPSRPDSSCSTHRGDDRG